VHLKAIIEHKVVARREQLTRKTKKMRKMMRWVISCKKVRRMTARMKRKSMTLRMRTVMVRTMMTMRLMRKEMT
jgi:hypothetical protein